MGEPQRLAAQRRHGVDVGVAVVVGAEGDRRAVRREAWERLLAAGGAEALGCSAGLRHHPDVAGVDEGDVRLGNVGLPQHAGVDLGLERLGRQQPQCEDGEDG